MCRGASDIGLAGGSPRFNDIDGSVKVKSINGSKIILQFSNFSFIKSQGSNKQTYVFNGSVTYNININ